MSSDNSLKAPPPPVYIFREHKSTVNNLHVFDRDQYLVSCDNDGWIVIWKMKTKRPILKWKAHESRCLQTFTIENHTKLVSQGRDNMIHIWKLPTATEQEHPPSSQQRIDNNPPELLSSIPYNGIAFCKLSCFESGHSVLLCFPSQEDLSMFDIYDLTQQRYILQNVADDTGTLRLGTCMALHVFIPPDANQLDKESEQALSTISNDTIYVLAGYESARVVLWELKATKHSERKKILWHKREHKEPILALALDPTYTFAISSSADNHLHKYSLSTGDIIQTATIKKSGVVSLKIRPDNKIFASGGSDNRIRLFSVKTMKPLAILSYHKDTVYSLEFGHDNPSMLIGGSDDNRISLWNMY